MRELDFRRARQAAERLLGRNPDDVEALMIAARSSVAEHDLSSMSSYCLRIPKSQRNSIVNSLLAEGKRLVEEGFARRAEDALRIALELAPANSDANYVLAFILVSESRAWDALPNLKNAIDQGRYDVPHLVIAAVPDEFFLDQPEFLKRCFQANPDDRVPRLPEARNALTRNDTATAGEILKQIAAADPWLVEAQVQWGKWLQNQKQEELLLAWLQNLSPEMETHPGTWAIRGLWAVEHGQPRAAIRCFAEAARIDPNLRVANYHLSLLLPDAGLRELSSRFGKRAQLLSELHVPLGSIMQQRDVAILQRIVSLLEMLGRPREAVAWTELFLRDADGDWAVDTVTRLRRAYPDRIPWIVQGERLADQIDVKSFPLPRLELTAASPIDPGAVGDAGIQFVEEAEKLGIRFQYLNDAKDPTNALRMFEFSGGGLAVIDYDRDGWPDLYATQGGHFPREPESTELLDRLYRNVGSSTEGAPWFRDVTNSARLGDPQYSQGASVGDFDQDGFPDLYVANIGPNRIYRNNGDGTFTDITSASDVDGDDWTTSCLLADLNGDGLPDLFDVNYLGGPDVYTRVCESGGLQRQCPPATFQPQPDRVWINQGDGSFGEAISVLQAETVSGRGLGVVATRSERSNLLDVFVANDTDPNFWYVNQTDVSTHQTAFEERGVTSGLAFDGGGNPQACMGIAAGDVDRNGLLDFYVTNFYRESNTLYLQQPGGQFADQTRLAGLRDASYSMLGFGTQFLDADNDGWLDIVLTNGHVYNNSHLGEPWKMPPQFFRNTGKGRFVELSADRAGAWFKGNYLGRSLVNWDWNRDGFTDFAVSHADVPLAVLTNKTPHAKHSVIITLNGVKSNRDAIGTKIVIKSGTDVWTHWLNAGDGFQASNDRRMVVGIGDHTVADEIVIHWPSGETQALASIAADREWIVVEGRDPVEHPR
ncbi:MAG: FG-GAP-like repeat-containing protein [Planctomycetaceae bacterium]